MKNALFYKFLTLQNALFYKFYGTRNALFYMFWGIQNALFYMFCKKLVSFREVHIVSFMGSTVHTQNEITFSKEKVPLNPQEQPLVSLKCPISTFAEIWGLFCVENNA